jgi:hypothetical protein
MEDLLKEFFFWQIFKYISRPAQAACHIDANV